MRTNSCGKFSGVARLSKCLLHLTQNRWGGRRARTSQQVSPEELQAYDAKIHRAMREMFTAMSGHLKSLGVPFFGVKSDLIVKDEDSEKEKQALMAKKKITESELLKLQRKMLEYLEAMYKD